MSGSRAAARDRRPVRVRVMRSCSAHGADPGAVVGVSGTTAAAADAPMDDAASVASEVGCAVGCAVVSAVGCAVVSAVVSMPQRCAI